MQGEYDRTQEYLINYFTGELNLILKRLKIRKNQKFTDDQYCTLNAYMLSPCKSRNKTGHADPTAARAVMIADINSTKENLYNNHLQLYNTIKKVLNNYDQEVINLLKANLGVGQSKTAAIKAASFGRAAGRKKTNQLYSELKKEMWPVFVKINRL